MRKQEYNSATVTLTSGESIKEVEFPSINGNITKIGTAIIGERYGKRVRLALKDGGNEVQRPVDVLFTETSGRASFEDGLMKKEIPNPGRITAAIQLDSALGAGETIKVEVLLVSEMNNQGHDNFENC